MAQSGKPPARAKPRPEWNNEVFDPLGQVPSSEKKPEVLPDRQIEEVQRPLEQPAEDMFDMNHGQFEEYNEQESIQTTEVYQMYEEMMDLIKNEYNPASSGGQSEQVEFRAGGSSDEEGPGSHGQRKEEDVQLPPSKFNFEQVNSRFQPKMTSVVEETEPESSFKETAKEKKPVRKQWNKVVAPVIEEREDLVTAEDDRDDDFSDESEDEVVKQAKNELKDFTFVPGSSPSDNHGHTFLAKSVDHEADFSKMSSIETIKSYLDSVLGAEKVAKLLPIIQSFGDDILNADGIPELKSRLAHIIKGADVDKYHQYFATLVFYELEIEKQKQSAKESPLVADQEAFNPAGMLNAINCFKDVSTTATFGKFGMKQTIGKKY